MIKVNVYSAKGVKKESRPLPKNIEESINLNLIAQAMRVYEDRKHPGFAKVKTRGEVKISTRKIYKQKGTGYARHGAKSAPIFVGGGIAHGPKGIKKKLKLSRKMRQKSLNIVLSLRAKEGNLILVDNLDVLKKTKDAKDFLEKIKNDREVKTNEDKFMFVLSQLNKDVQTVLRNLKNVKVVFYKNLSAIDAYRSRVIIFDKKAFDENKNITKTESKAPSNVITKLTIKSTQKKGKSPVKVKKPVKSKVRRKSK